MKQVSTEQLSYNDFKKEEIDKINKRMSVEFIKEYIKYINARNQYNDKPHTKEELKQKVMDYAKHANIDPKDNKAIRHLETSQNLKDQHGLEYLGTGTYKNVVGFNAKIGKKNKKQIAFVNQNLDNDALPGFGIDTIVASAILGLFERQPKYYTLCSMKQVDCYENIENAYKIALTTSGKIKKFARQIIMPVDDDQPKNTFYYGKNGETASRVSRIDLDMMLLYPAGADNVEVPNFFYDEKSSTMLKPEILKMLCITPELVRMTIKQHLKSVNIDDETIKQQIDRGLKFVLLHLQRLKLLCKRVKGATISDKEINNMIDLPQAWKYFEKKNIVSSNNTFIESVKILFKDDTIKTKIDNNIKTFQNYLYLPEKIDTITTQYPILSKYKKSITTYLQKEIDNGKNIKNIKIDDIVKQIASKTNNPTLYWKAVMKERQKRNKKVDYQKCSGERGWNKSTNTKNNINLTDITKNKELKENLKR